MRVDLQRPLGPVIEKISSYEPAFLSEDPLDIMLQGKYHKVPFLLGYTSREGMLVELTVPKKHHLLTTFEEAIPFNLRIPKGSALSLKTAHKIKQFYYGTKEPTLDDMDPLYQVRAKSIRIKFVTTEILKIILFQLHTDNFFYRGIYMTAKHHSSTSPEPVYFYKFCIDGPMNMLKKFAGIERPGEYLY